MTWKDLWNKKYLMISVYVLLTALLYHLGSRVVDHLEGLPSFMDSAFFLVISGHLSSALRLCTGLFAQSSLFLIGESFGEIPIF